MTVFPLGMLSLVLCLILVTCVFILAFWVASKAQRPGAASSWLLAAYSLVLTLLSLEMVFHTIPRSHGVGYTYAARNWMQRYWHVNKLGYRDREIAPDEAAAKKHILVVGDSFVAGHGIRDPADRFSDVLGTLVAKNYIVFNVAHNGADTREELDMLNVFPYAPDILVLSYFPNDIEGAAKRQNRFHFAEFSPYADVSRLVASLIRSSYLLDYIYWSFPRGDMDGYLPALTEAYADPQVLQEHLRDIDEIVRFSQLRSVPLVVVFFPFLQDVEGSRALLVPALDFLKTRGVAILDVSELVDKVPVADRVVNGSDGHPSITVHAQVARALYKKLSVDLRAFELPNGRIGLPSKTESQPVASAR